MNHYAIISMLAAPAACVCSCTSSESVKTFAATEIISELASLIASHKDSDVSVAVNDLHSYLSRRTDFIIVAVKDMSDDDKMKLIQGIKQSEELKKLIEVIMSMEDGKLVKTYTEADDLNPEKIAGDLPFETKMQLIDIVADIAKISVALGVEKEKIRDSF